MWVLICIGCYILSALMCFGLMYLNLMMWCSSYEELDSDWDEFCDEFGAPMGIFNPIALPFVSILFICTCIYKVGRKYVVYFAQQFEATKDLETKKYTFGELIAKIYYGNSKK